MLRKSNETDEIYFSVIKVLKILTITSIRCGQHQVQNYDANGLSYYDNNLLVRLFHVCYYPAAGYCDGDALGNSGCSVRDDHDSWMDFQIPNGLVAVKLHDTSVLVIHVTAGTGLV